MERIDIERLIRQGEAARRERYRKEICRAVVWYSRLLLAAGCVIRACELLCGGADSMTSALALLLRLSLLIFIAVRLLFFREKAFYRKRWR